MSESIASRKSLTLASFHNALHSTSFADRARQAKTNMRHAEVVGSRKDIFVTTLRYAGAQGILQSAKASAVPGILLGNNTFGLSYAKQLRQFGPFNKDIIASLLRPHLREGVLPHVAHSVVGGCGLVMGGFVGVGLGAIAGAALGLGQHGSLLGSVIQGALEGAAIGGVVGALALFVPTTLAAHGMGVANLLLRGTMLGSGALMGYGYGILAGAANAVRCGGRTADATFNPAGDAFDADDGDETSDAGDAF